MKSLILAAIAAVALPLGGCTSTLDAMLEQVGAEPGTASQIESTAIGIAARPIPIYCNAPLITREPFRDRVNSHEVLQGAKIGIWCPGDPELVLGPDPVPDPVPTPPPAPSSPST